MIDDMLDPPIEYTMIVECPYCGHRFDAVMHREFCPECDGELYSD